MWLFIVACVIIAYIVSKFYALLYNFQCKSPVFLGGKTALVTGGSAGLGYEIVLSLASRGCRVIIADINADQSIAEEIIKKTHNKDIKIMHVDLTSFKSVRKLADNLKQSEEKLDILINNAGLGSTNYNLTEDGCNHILQINFYSHFLLTHLLLDLLKKSSSAKIIFTASMLSFLYTVSIKNILQKNIHKQGGTWSYANSKILTIIGADMFAKKLLKYNIRCNTWHPLMAKTTIFRSSFRTHDNGQFVWNIIAFSCLHILSFLIGKEPVDGAQTAIHLACTDENVTGLFFGEGKPRSKPSLAYNEEFRNAFWESSEELVELKSEERI